MKALIGLALLGAVIFAVINWTHFYSFPQILPSYTAKMHCSCLYVMKQDEGFCKEWSRQWLPYQSLQVDKESRVVRVQGLGRSAEARFISERYGCELIVSSRTP